MKKVILEDAEAAHIDLIPDRTPIFAKKNGRLAGMVVKDPSGWILRTGGKFGAYGYFADRTKCIEGGAEYGYEFFVDIP